MSNGFTLGGVTAKALDIIMLRQSRRPILPSTVDRTLTIPGRHGAWDFGADLAPLAIDLECAMITSSKRDLQTAIDRLVALLLDHSGRPRTLELIFDTTPERMLYVRYSGSLSVDRLVGSGAFTLPLVAFDPFSYVYPTAYNVDYLYDQGLQYDTNLIYPNTESFQWTNRYQMSSLYNYGSLNAGLRIDILGKVKNPKITNISTGKSVQLAIDHTDDDVLVIDGRRMRAYRSDRDGETSFLQSSQFPDYVGRMNVLGTLSGDFFDLVVGENKLVFEGIGPNAAVYYRWFNTYI